MTYFSRENELPSPAHQVQNVTTFAFVCVFCNIKTPNNSLLVSVTENKRTKGIVAVRGGIRLSIKKGSLKSKGRL